MAGYVLDLNATPQPTTTGAVALSTDGNTLAYTDNTNNTRLYIAKKINGVWSLVFTSAASFIPSGAKSDMRFSYDGTKLVIVVPPNPIIVSVDAITGACTLDAFVSGAEFTIGYADVRWHPSALILVASNINASPFTHMVKWNGTQWGTLGVDNVSARCSQGFSTDGLRLISMGNAAVDSAVYNFSTTTGIGTVLVTPFDTVPFGPTGKVESWSQGAVQGFVCTKATSPFVSSFLWDPTALSGQGQYKLKTSSLVPSGGTLLRISSVFNNGTRYLVLSNNSPFFASMDISSGGVVTVSANQPDRTGVTAIPINIGSAPSARQIMVASATGAPNRITTYDFEQQFTSSMVGFKPTNETHIAVGVLISSAMVGFKPTNETDISITEDLTVTSEMVGFLPTNATIINTAKAITSAMVGFKPTNETLIDVHTSVISAMVGFKPTNETLIEAHTSVSSAMVGFKPTNDTEIAIATTIASAMVGFMSTSAISIDMSEHPLDTVSEMIGFLPTNDTEVRIAIAVSSAMVGFLPVSATFIDVHTAVVSAMVGFKPTNETNVTISDPIVSVECTGASIVHSQQATITGVAHAVPSPDYTIFKVGTVSGGPYTMPGNNNVGNGTDPQAINFTLAHGELTPSTTYYFVVERYTSLNVLVETSDECSFETNATGDEGYLSCGTSSDLTRFAFFNDVIAAQGDLPVPASGDYLLYESGPSNTGPWVASQIVDTDLETPLDNPTIPGTLTPDNMGVWFGGNDHNTTVFVRITLFDQNDVAIEQLVCGAHLMKDRPNPGSAQLIVSDVTANTAIITLVDGGPGESTSSGVYSQHDSMTIEYSDTPGGPYTSQDGVDATQSGSIDVPGPALLTGLQPATQYYFRVVLTETQESNDVFYTSAEFGSFMTDALEIEAFCSGGSFIDETVANLNGSVSALNFDQAAHFEYSLSDLGPWTATADMLTGPIGVAPMTVQITGLMKGTIYYFKTVITGPADAVVTESPICSLVTAGAGTGPGEFLMDCCPAF